MVKTVIYTVITGGYDKVHVPKVATDGVDYIIFTDNDKVDCGIWQKRPIPEELSDLSDVKKQRCIKINAHKYLSEYDFSVYVDGSIEITADLSLIIDKYQSYVGKFVFMPKHPSRNCIYKEANACKFLKKDKKENIDKTIEHIKSDGYPQNNGLVQSNIIMRWHNEDYCVRLMEKWWETLSEYSHRDQLSFNYALWKTEGDGFQYMDSSTCNNRPFKWHTSHSNGGSVSKFRRCFGNQHMMY